MKHTDPLEAVCALLNQALRNDPMATEELVKARVPCSQSLGTGALDQCGMIVAPDGTIGLVGLLNGLAQSDDARRLVAVVKGEPEGATYLKEGLLVSFSVQPVATLPFAGGDKGFSSLIG